jgi:hypothetical protein
MKLNFYNDPGHGWVAVKKALLVTLGIADEISAYSYERGGMAHLEEDVDAGLLIAALKNRGIPVEFINHTTNRRSKIRSYSGYKRPADVATARMKAEATAAKADM